MKTQMEQRLRHLKSEHEEGKKRLADLQQTCRDLEATLMRINGAIQILEEMIADESERAAGKTSGT